MISDTLHEATAEIERYQHSFPKCYDGLRVEIGKVKAVMIALRTWLDCPPSTGRYPRLETALGRLRAGIANLDVEPLLSAMDDLKAAWPTPGGGRGGEQAGGARTKSAPEAE